MGSYTFMDGGYPGAAVAGADAQNHGSIMREVDATQMTSGAGSYGRKEALQTRSYAGQLRASESRIRWCE